LGGPRMVHPHRLYGGAWRPNAWWGEEWRGHILGPSQGRLRMACGIVGDDDASVTNPGDEGLTTARKNAKGQARWTNAPGGGSLRRILIPSFARMGSMFKASR